MLTTGEGRFHYRDTEFTEEKARISVISVFVVLSISLVIPQFVESLAESRKRRVARHTAEEKVVLYGEGIKEAPGVVMLGLQSPGAGGWDWYDDVSLPPGRIIPAKVQK